MMTRRDDSNGDDRRGAPAPFPLQRLLALADDGAPLGALDALEPVTDVPDWVDDVIQRHAPPVPVGEAHGLAADGGQAADTPSEGRVLRFPTRWVRGSALLALAAAVVVFLTRPPTPAVPLDDFSVAAPVAALSPPPLAGSAFVGDTDRGWIDIELGYRFAFMQDLASSDGAPARYASVEARRAWSAFARHRAARGGTSAEPLLAAAAVADRAGRLAAARAALDDDARADFEAGRWLYLAARHRAHAGPLPPAPDRNAAALRHRVGDRGSASLQAALDALARDPAHAPLAPVLDGLVGVKGGER